MSRRSVVIPPPPDPVELDELPPDPGPRWPDWPDPPGPRVPPEYPPVIGGWILGGDPDPLLPPGPSGSPGPGSSGSGSSGSGSSGSGSVDVDSLTDLDRLLGGAYWDRDAAARALLNLDPPSWATAPAGPELAAALDGVRVSTASPVALIELMKAATRLQAWAEATTTAAMAAFWHHRQQQAAARAADGDPDYDNEPARRDPMRGAAHEIAAALHLPPRTALGHIDHAVRLTRDLPATLTALRAGQITMTKARVILDTTAHLSLDHQRAVQDRVLTRAPDQTRAQLGAACRRAAITVDPDGENTRHKHAKKHREITVRPLPDGMAQLTWTDSADLIQTAWIVLNCLADAAKTKPKAKTGSNAKAGSKAKADAGTTGSNTGSRDSGTAGTGTTEPGSATGTGSPGSPGSPGSTETGSPDPASPEPGSSTGPSSAGPGSTQTGSTQTGSTQTGSSTGPGSSAGPGSTGPDPDPGSTGPDPDPGSAGPGPGSGPDRRTADQRRCDAAADLFRILLDQGTDWLDRPFPTQQRRRPHIEVLIPITVLLGIREDPCELAGYGPIPSDLARQIATQGTWRRLLTDPATGTVLEASTTRHDPPAQVSETVLARDQTCRGIGCRMPARRCDRDHGIKFKHSLRTQLHDLSAACETHHQIKDDDTSGWTMQQQPDATIHWTTPTGHTYTTEPPSLGPIADTQPPSQPPEAEHTQPPDHDPPPF